MCKFDIVKCTFVKWLILDQGKMASQHQYYGGGTEHSLNICSGANTNLFNSDRLNYEEERIKSFASWPVHYPVDAYRLAKAGFYYTGVEDEVVCFSCHGHIKNWNYGDIVLKKHADLYPNCDFIKNVSNNVPFIKTSIKSKAQPLIIEEVDKINRNISNSNTTDYNKMKCEHERLKTFVGRWPLLHVKAADLACAGFFYTGIDDKVQCPFCTGTKGNWEIGSIPLQEHLKHFPWCDFVSKNITKVQKEQSWFQSSSQDICGNMKPVDSSSSETSNNRLIDQSQQHANLEDLGVHLHKEPIHPQQASLMARLRSFSTWPLDAPVSKEDLAVAGFFYIGIGDRTICFHCNGGLCSWEKGDDPWVEHARWFSACDFLRLNKGDDFIKAWLVKNPPKLLKESVLQQSHRSTVEPLLKEVDKAMKSNLVKHILDSEIFPPYIIRAAILLQIKETGNNFSNVDDLCVAASYLKEEMENKSIPIKPVKAEDLNICQNISENCTISEIPQETNKVWQSPSCSVTSDKKNLKNGPKESAMLEDDSKDNCLCKICMDKEVGVVFLPCGHLPACTICAPALKFCPMCRKPIQAYARCYLN